MILFNSEVQPAMTFAKLISWNTLIMDIKEKGHWGATWQCLPEGSKFWRFRAGPPEMMMIGIWRWSSSEERRGGRFRLPDQHNDRILVSLRSWPCLSLREEVSLSPWSLFRGLGLSCRAVTGILLSFSPISPSGPRPLSGTTLRSGVK